MTWLINKDDALKLKSPKAHVVGGPYCVVKVGEDNEWVLVALDWKWNGHVSQALGIRWFVVKPGMPSVFGHPMWFIIPGELSKLILDSLPEDNLVMAVRKFLKNDKSYTGKELMQDLGLV